MTDEKTDSISKLNSVQSKTPSIGNKLRAARLKKGRTIDAVNQETRISKRFIAAMEEDRFEEIPGGSYLRSFLKGYCEYLDIDFDELGFVEDSKSTATSDQTKNISESAESLDSSSIKVLPAQRENFRNIIIGSVVALAVLMTLFFEHKSNPQKKILAHQKIAGDSVVQAPSAPKTAPPQKKDESSLLIDLLKPARLVVSVDGNIKFRGLAPAGAQQTWWAKREFIFWTNFPAALKISLNGQVYPLPNPDIKGNYHIKVKSIYGGKTLLSHKKNKKPGLKPSAKPNPIGMAQPVGPNPPSLSQPASTSGATH